MELGFIIAAAAGAGSFFSPCMLPVLPAFLSYLSGSSVQEISKTSSSIKLTSTRLNIFLNTVFFVLGFSLVFSVLGVMLNSVLSGIAADFTIWLTRVGGIMIISFGLYMLASTKLHFLNFEKRFTVKRFKISYPTSFMFGLAFAAAWTPCVGPILASIFTLAATLPGQAFNLLFAYSLGLGVPFLLTGIFFSQSTNFVSKMSRHLKYFNVIMGSILIVLGILVFSNQLALLGNFPVVNQIILS
ncbi:MAG: cytochrome c biogenesis protein CcdA [Nitrososphaerales archaeon]